MRIDHSPWEPVWSHPSEPSEIYVDRKECPGGWIYRMVDRRGAGEISKAMLSITFVPFPEGHPRPAK